MENITLILSKDYNDKSIIEKIGGIVDKDGNISISYNPKQETSRDILKKAEEAGLKVNDFSVTGASLETIFLSMTFIPFFSLEKISILSKAIFFLPFNGSALFVLINLC